MSIKLEQYMLISNIKQLYQGIGKRLHSIDDGTCLWKKNNKYQKYYDVFNKTVSSCRKINKIRVYQIKALSYLLDHGINTKKHIFDKKFGSMGDFNVPYP